MLHNRPIRLNVSSSKEFAVPVFILGLLALLAALLSPKPLLMTLILILISGAMRCVFLLTKKDSSDVEMTSVIFPDGRVRLESNQELTAEGFLDGQQWCTGNLAVLRIVIGGSVSRLVIQSRQQRTADDFRRLMVRLRLDWPKDVIAKQKLAD